VARQSLITPEFAITSNQEHSKSLKLVGWSFRRYPCRSIQLSTSSPPSFIFFHCDSHPKKKTAISATLTFLQSTSYLHLSSGDNLKFLSCLLIYLQRQSFRTSKNINNVKYNMNCDCLLTQH
jgi:hypothetical protein